MRQQRDGGRIRLYAVRDAAEGGTPPAFRQRRDQAHQQTGNRPAADITSLCAAATTSYGDRASYSWGFLRASAPGTLCDGSRATAPLRLSTRCFYPYKYSVVFCETLMLYRLDVCFGPPSRGHSRPPCSSHLFEAPLEPRQCVTQPQKVHVTLDLLLRLSNALSTVLYLRPRCCRASQTRVTMNV